MSVVPYRKLLYDFIERNLTAQKFEKEFLSLFKNEGPLLDREFEILNQMFYSVEDFILDPSLRGSGDIGETELRECAIRCLEALDNVEFK